MTTTQPAPNSVVVKQAKLENMITGNSGNDTENCLPTDKNESPTNHIKSDSNSTSHDHEDKKSIADNIDKEAAKPGLIAVAKKRHVHQKFVHILSISTVMVLALCLMNIHWFIPYYYAISTPILLVIRFVMYWKNKWQYFLIDFCYFANVFCYTFIWAAPHHSEAALVLFAFANGPLTWATIMFRNSLVFHDVDRVTSCYIHILPMFLSFGLRWFPSEMSLRWYTAFNAVYSEDLAYMFIWIFAVPFACFVFHTCLYMLIVYGICKPDEQYLNSFRYMTAKRTSWQGKVLYACGDKCTLLMYITINWLYCLCSLLLTLLLYKYYVAHIIYMVLIMLIVVSNGGAYYLDVFAVRGLKG